MDNFGLIREGTGNAVLKRIPMPKLRDNYMIVRTVAIALNPTDWTTLDAKGDDGTIVGCDYSGIVEEVGSAVTKPFKKGDRVAGFSHGGNAHERTERTYQRQRAHSLHSQRCISGRRCFRQIHHRPRRPTTAYS